MDPSDKRSKLVFTFLDAVEIVRPRFFAMENVKALGTLGKWASVRDAMLQRAAAMGYAATCRVWRTSDFGVPQNRDRMILVGVRDGDPEKFNAAMDAQKQQAPASRDVLLSAGAYGTRSNPDTCAAAITLAKHPVLRQSPYAGMLVNGAGRPINLDGLPPTLPATMGGNKTPIVDQRALVNAATPNWFAEYHARLLSGDCHPADATVPRYVRRLTLKEAAAIQTFPETYTFCGARTGQYRQIGNAVPVLFAHAVAASLRSAYSA